MRILRLAAWAIAASLLLASPRALPQMSHGHMGGGGHQFGGFHGGQSGGFHGGFHGGHSGGFRGGQFGGFHGGQFAHPGGVPFHGGFHHPGGFRRGGAFVHGFHGGRVGWFFVVGGFWYPWVASPGPVFVNTWYYCPSAWAYYPSVTFCPEGWVLVTPGVPVL
jgi:hypothetical protein